MTTTTKTRKNAAPAYPKLAFRRIGPSDYGLTLNPNSAKPAELRITGTYVRGSSPDSTVSNAWVWTARLNGEVVDSPETITRKRDAIVLLCEELTKQNLWEAPFTNVKGLAGEKIIKKSAVKLPSREEALATAKKAAAQTHPIFRPAATVTAESSANDPIMNATVRVKGTTLVGEVIAKTTGEKERLRVQSPEGFCIWALRDVIEEVAL